MTLEEAIKTLQDTERFELRDHAFGDREVFWQVKGNPHADIATGYYSGTVSEARVYEQLFTGVDALKLLDCGTLHVERNDETGPDTYQDGKIMEGLTKEAVLREITTPKD